MALFHFDVRQIKRSAGQSAIACAAYRSGQKLTATTMANGAITAARAVSLALKSCFRMDIIPTTQHILDNYNHLTITEKNHLWKMVLQKVTVYRTPAGELSVHIYPKLPK